MKKIRFFQEKHSFIDKTESMKHPFKVLAL